ncbi:hypothetical protein D3879_08605 [Pseudomonas cavernicola]|uniref:Uncharacterized protein n=1 Tax=Pseudomonas cavernicola TaxID=2320866 RepID=A0A418XLG9_9PSED|nr:hypothetical protein D3879_08605 [Pseudomonas cavernicola]
MHLCIGAVAQGDPFKSNRVGAARVTGANGQAAFCNIQPPRQGRAAHWVFGRGALPYAVRRAPSDSNL